MENSIDIFLFLCYNKLTEYLFLGVIVMKKIAALVLSGLMILSLGVASFAAQGDSAEDPGKLVIIDAKDKDGADIKDQVKVVENDDPRRQRRMLLRRFSPMYSVRITRLLSLLTQRMILITPEAVFLLA